MNKSKILGLILIAVSIVMIGLGFGKPGVVDAFKIYWMATAAALIPGVLLLAGLESAAIYMARIITGAVFVVSGLIKANDTVGFGIKLEEYFDENALGAFWANFHDFALPISFFVSGIEVLLGLALLFGAKARLVSWTLLIMTVFFGWLTYFTASCNGAQMAAMAAGESFERICVTDCGCFGDALRGSVGRSLTPWESFYKDLGLFFLTIVILLFNSRIKLNRLQDNVIIFPLAFIIMLVFGGWLFGWMLPTYFYFLSIIVFFAVGAFSKGTESKRAWVFAIAMAVITYGFAFYTYQYLPVKDYRPYKIGVNIKNQMLTAEELGVEGTEYANVYILENQETGEKKTMNSKDYLAQEFWKDESWKIASTLPEPIVIKHGYEPPIQTFVVMDEDENEVGDEILNNPNYSFMVVMYDMKRTRGEAAAKKLKTLAEEADAAGVEIFVVTSSPYDVYEQYRHDHQLAVKFYTADEIFLKTIIRSNPGVLLLKDGDIVHKWSAAEIPSFEKIQSKYMK